MSESNDTNVEKLVFPRRNSKVVRFNKEVLSLSRSKFTETQLTGAMKKRGRGDSLMTYSRNTISAYDFLCRQEEVKIWLNEIFSLEIHDLIKEIKDGVLLCELCNRISPNSITKINKKNSPPFLQMENINFFLDACQKLAAISEPIDMFSPIDLYEEKNIPKVIKCLASVEKAARLSGFSVVIRPISQDVVLSFTEEEISRATQILKKSTEPKSILKPLPETSENEEYPPIGPFVDPDSDIYDEEERKEEQERLKRGEDYRKEEKEGESNSESEEEKYDTEKNDSGSESGSESEENTSDENSSKEEELPDVKLEQEEIGINNKKESEEIYEEKIVSEDEVSKIETESLVVEDVGIEEIKEQNIEEIEEQNIEEIKEQNIEEIKEQNIEEIKEQNLENLKLEVIEQPTEETENISIQQLGEESKIKEEETKEGRVDEVAETNLSKKESTSGNLPPKKKIKPYQFIKSDRIDAMLAEYLSKAQKTPEELAALVQPIKRITQGLYMVGETKVYMKEINSHLVARVGGGWMRIEEFMKRYSTMSYAPTPMKINKEAVSSATSNSDTKKAEVKESLKKEISPKRVNSKETKKIEPKVVPKKLDQSKPDGAKKVPTNVSATKRTSKVEAPKPTFVRPSRFSSALIEPPRSRQKIASKTPTTVNKSENSTPTKPTLTKTVSKGNKITETTSSKSTPRTSSSNLISPKKTVSKPLVSNLDSDKEETTAENGKQDTDTSSQSSDTTETVNVTNTPPKSTISPSKTVSKTKRTNIEEKVKSSTTVTTTKPRSTTEIKKPQIPKQSAVLTKTPTKTPTKTATISTTPPSTGRRNTVSAPPTPKDKSNI